MNTNRVIQTWWDNMLVKIPGKVLAQWALPVDTRKFLETVGLPLDDRLVKYFAPGYGFKFTPHDLRSLEYEQVIYTVIGVMEFYDGHGNICLKEKSGQCFLLDARPNASAPLQFINTNIEALLLFLKAVVQYTPRLRELSHEMDNLIQQRKTQTEEGKPGYRQLRNSLSELVESLHQEFLRIDSEAITLSDAETYTYWGMYLDDWN